MIDDKKEFKSKKQAHKNGFWRNINTEIVFWTVFYALFVGFFSLTILTGCAQKKDVTYIPHYQRCPPPIIPKEPNYETAKLTPEDKKNTPKVIKSLVVSYHQCRHHSAVLTKKLDGYK